MFPTLPTDNYSAASPTGPAAGQTSAPVTTGLTSPKSQSNHSTITAHEQADAISTMSPHANGADADAKEVVEVGVNSHCSKKLCRVLPLVAM